MQRKQISKTTIWLLLVMVVGTARIADENAVSLKDMQVMLDAMSDENEALKKEIQSLKMRMQLLKCNLQMLPVKMLSMHCFKRNWIW